MMTMMMMMMMIIIIIHHFLLKQSLEFLALSWQVHGIDSSQIVHRSDG
jgi:hypothetical protein